MLKKLLSLAMFSVVAFSMSGQTIVSTSPENKKVILEEFTGINCVFCPDGHAIAQSIQTAHPGNVFLINVHQGGFATPTGGQPDFRTPFGNAIAGQTGLTGYPSGTINRLVFPGRENTPGGTAIYRNYWTISATETLATASYANVGVEATIDVQNNEIVVHVEGYYTADSPIGTNLLNVALLQNNTAGPQTGGGQGNNYNHMHRLVHLITGQWGVEIPVTTSGTFVDETFTYTIPAMYNSVPVDIGELELVAFITETHQKIVSGNGTFPLYTGITTANDAGVEEIAELPSTCETSVTPTVKIRNYGQDPITSVDIEYSINGGATETYTWTGNLTSYQRAIIELPEINFTMQATNTLTVNIPSDDNNANNTMDAEFDESPAGTGNVDMVLHTDQYGSECTWNIKNSAGTTLYNGGPYGANQTINVSFELPEDCITFNLIDSYGDGGGGVTLTDSDGTQLFYTNGNYGSGVAHQFSSNGVLGIHDAELQRIVIYPNPATSILNIKNAEGASITIYDVLGKQMATQTIISNEGNVDVSRFQTGTYFIKIMTENGVKTQTFLVRN